MPGRTTEPLSERIERYERIRRARDHGVSLQSIGRAEGLTKQRVAEILGQGAPTSQSGGRPWPDPVVPLLRRQKWWENKATRQRRAGEDPAASLERARRLGEEIAKVRRA